MKTYKVISSNPSNEGTTHVTKMLCVTEIPDELFGVKLKKETLYMSAPNKLEIGLDIPETKLFPKYKIVEHPMINPETNEEFMGKWLHCA